VDIELAIRFGHDPSVPGLPWRFATKIFTG
jgi:hypothetical protein